MKQQSRPELEMKAAIAELKKRKKLLELKVILYECIMKLERSFMFVCTIKRDNVSPCIPSQTFMSVGYVCFTKKKLATRRLEV